MKPFLFLAALWALAAGADDSRHMLSVGDHVGLSGASVSADGRYLAHTDWSTGDLAITDLRTGEERRVTNKGPLRKLLEFAESFTRFSPDGNRLAYIWDRNGYQLEVINVDGSGRRRIYPRTPVHTEMRAYDWSADGKYVVAAIPNEAVPRSRELRLALLGMDEPSVRVLRELPAGGVPASARFSPDHRHIAYEVVYEGEKSARIFIHRLDADAEPTALASGRLIAWAPNGAGILRIDAGEGRSDVWFHPLGGGSPRIVARKIPADIRPLGLTSEGTLYYAVSLDSQHGVYTGIFDRDAGKVKDLRALSATGFNQAPDWSPDGRFVAYVHRSRGIVIRSVDDGRERVILPKGMVHVFTVGSGHQYARWSPDGTKLLVPQNRVIFLVDAVSAEATPALSGGRSRYGRWSRDGAIFYSRQAGSNDAPFQLVKLAVNGGQQEIIYRSEASGDNVNGLELSPDGRWLAFSDVTFDAATDEERAVVRVMPSSGGAATILVKGEPGEEIRVVGWTPDSDEVLFTREPAKRSRSSRLVWRIPVDGGVPRSLDMGRSVLTSVRFHPDGRRIVFDSGTRGAEIRAIKLSSDR